MDAIVTARIPVEVKEQGNAILREIGSSPTRLINAAYRYLLATHELPSPRVVVEYDGSALGGSANKEVRVISAEMRLKAEALLAASTLPAPREGWEDRDYRQIIAEGRSVAYEALA